MFIQLVVHQGLGSLEFPLPNYHVPHLWTIRKEASQAAAIDLARWSNPMKVGSPIVGKRSTTLWIVLLHDFGCRQCEASLPSLPSPKHPNSKWILMILLLWLEGLQNSQSTRGHFSRCWPRFGGPSQQGRWALIGEGACPGAVAMEQDGCCRWMTVMVMDNG